MDNDVLAKSVVCAWERLDPEVLTKVANRWKLVLQLILEDDGDNRLVETRRGKLMNNPSPGRRNRR
ncbi:MAG: hypothetical protein ACREBR_03820 [bacterium]